VSGQGEFSSRVYEAIFNIAPVGLILLDAEKHILAWNAWLQTKTGISADEARGKTAAELYPEQNFMRYDWAVEQAITFGNPQVISQALNRFLIPIEINDGPYKSLQYMQQYVEIHPIEDDDKQYALVVISDVTTSYYEKSDLLSLAKQFSKESVKDALTGTYNRRYMWEWLTQAMEKAKRSSEVILCCIYDIDHFKDINDSLGHEFGDKAILHFVNVLKELTREDDIIVRYGGDEFISLSLMHRGTKDISDLPRRVVEQLREKPVENSETFLTTSCGYTIWDPVNNRVDSKELLEQADKGLYVAKEDGRNCYKPYQE